MPILFSLRGYAVRSGRGESNMMRKWVDISLGDGKNCGSKGVFHPCKQNGTATFRQCQRQILQAGGYQRCSKDMMTQQDRTKTQTRWATSMRMKWKHCSEPPPTPSVSKAAMWSRA